MHCVGGILCTAWGPTQDASRPTASTTSPSPQWTSERRVTCTSSLGAFCKQAVPCNLSRPCRPPGPCCDHWQPGERARQEAAQMAHRAGGWPVLNSRLMPQSFPETGGAHCLLLAAPQAMSVGSRPPETTGVLPKRSYHLCQVCPPTPCLDQTFPAAAPPQPGPPGVPVYCPRSLPVSRHSL